MNMPISTENSQSYAVKAIYALLGHICPKKNLCTSSGNFLHVKVCRPESFDSASQSI